jgi:hypothetical protein
MEFVKFVEWAFYGIVSGCAIYLVTILSSIKDSIDKLNINMAVIIEKTHYHEKRIEKLEEKIY